MLTAGLRLGPAPGSGRPLGCPAVARSRRLVLYSPARRLLAPIAAGSASEEWERRQDGSDSAERRGRRRQGGEGRHPGRDRQVGQRSGDANARSQRSRGGSTDRERSSSSSSSGRQRYEDITPLMEAVKACHSCAAVWQLVQQEDARAASKGHGGVHIYVLSSALDSMKKKAACEGGSEADRRAVAQLLRLATERLGEFGPRQLVAYVRCAAAFKGVLQRVQLTAWQAAVLPHNLQRASAQDVSNMLLSLGTLAESDERLAAVASGRLAEWLMQHAAQLAAAGELNILQQPANCLYGAALLGLQPTAAQADAMFGAVQQALEEGQLGISTATNVTQLLLGCAKLMGVQTEPGATPTPGEDPFLRFYPGAGLVDALLRRATPAPLGPQAVTQLVGACGGLLHMPGRQEGTALLAALREHADNMNAIDASALLMGCARLGAPPGPAAIQACVAAVEREGLNSSREASNIAWALAVLEVCDLRTWQRLMAVVASHIASIRPVELAQWAQAHQLMQLRHGQGISCPSELLQRSQISWTAQLQHLQQQQQRGKAASRFERLLAAAVADLAGSHAVQSAHIAAGSSGQPLALVDVALPQLRIAVEADGPRHFLRNRQDSGGQPLPDGPTRARDRLLEGHGWRVVAVSYHLEWDRLMAAGARTDAELQAGLRRYLEERTGLAAAIVERTAA